MAKATAKKTAQKKSRKPTRAVRAVKPPAKTRKSPTKAAKHSAESAKPKAKTPKHASAEVQGATAAEGRSTKHTKSAVRPEPAAADRRTEAGKGALGAAQKLDLRDLLLGMKSHFAEQVQMLKKDSLRRNDEVNPEEDGTDAFDRQFALSIASSEQESLSQIEEALRRLDDGTYGVCEECGETIETLRLQALPFVRMCIRCQSQSEKGRGFRRPALFREL